MLIEKQLLLLLLQMLLPVDAAKTNLSIVFGVAKKKKERVTAATVTTATSSQ